MPSPTGHSPASFYDFSGGNNSIASVLSGWAWGDSLGSGVSLTYSFPWSSSGNAFFDTSAGNYNLNSSNELIAGTEPNRLNRFEFEAIQQGAARDALAQWSTVANVRFKQVADNASVVGDLRFAFTTVGPDEGGHAYFPGNSAIAGDIWLDGSEASGAFATMTEGTYGYYTLLHEIGHAIGLKHPFEGTPRLTGSLDSMDNTVMAYFSGHPDFFPTTPMWYDIAAAQYLYGANMKHRAGNDTYVYFENQKYWETIWDAGGTDTIQYEGSGPGIIDLRPGAGQDLGLNVNLGNGQVLFGTITIYGTVKIENATGGSGGDSITGNSGSNVLNGRGGADQLFGLAGNDTFVFFADTIAGPSATVTDAGSPGVAGTGRVASVGLKNVSADRFDGGGGTDTLNGTEGADLVLLDGSTATPRLAGIEVIDARGGDDIVDLTSSRFTYGAVTIFGGAGNDVLWGNAGNDVLNGGAGNDQLVGGAGDDSLSTGAGKDGISGGVGNDLLRLPGARSEYVVTRIGNEVIFSRANGDEVRAIDVDRVQFAKAAPIGMERILGSVPTEFNDILVGTSAGDTIHGLGGNDTVRGNGGDDTLFGDAGNDELLGGAGDDTLDGGAGDDFLRGGTGNDTYLVGLGDQVFESAKQGSDLVRTSLSSFTLAANVENLVYTGTGTFAGTGNASANRLTGGAGNDVLDGARGADRLIGGAGDDRYVIDNAKDRVVETADGGIDTLLTARGKLSLGALYANVENLTYTGSGNFTGTGNALGNAIAGGAGKDVLNGGAGDDALAGGAGNDTLNGGAGVDDAVLAGARAGYVFARLSLTSVRVTNTASGEVDLLKLVERVRFGDGSTGMLTLNDLLANTASAFDDVYNGGGGADTFDALGGNDQIRGNGGNDTLLGGAGNDLLDGGAGNDSMGGGSGNDTYVVDHALDQVFELARAGTDVVKTALATLQLAANVEQLVYTGAGSFQGLGNTLNNRITGGAGSDLLNGGLGVDTLIGGAGNDRYVIDGTADRVVELAGGGTDTIHTTLRSFSLAAVDARTGAALYANVENLSVIGGTAFTGTGNALGNLLRGGQGNDSLRGGAGDDVLAGANGVDTLDGGAGNDAFLFDSIPGGTADRIIGFVSGADSLRFDNATFFGGLANGPLAPGAFSAGNFTAGQEADDRIIYNTSTGAVYYDADGSGPAAAAIVATLVGRPLLTADDIDVI